MVCTPKTTAKKAVQMATYPHSRQLSGWQKGSQTPMCCPRIQRLEAQLSLVEASRLLETPVFTGRPNHLVNPEGAKGRETINGRVRTFLEFARAVTSSGRELYLRDYDDVDLNGGYPVTFEARLGEIGASGFCRELLIILKDMGVRFVRILVPEEQQAETLVLFGADSLDRVPVEPIISYYWPLPNPVRHVRQPEKAAV